jgi:hypothetical protein
VAISWFSRPCEIASVALLLRNDVVTQPQNRRKPFSRPYKKHYFSEYTFRISCQENSLGTFLEISKKNCFYNEQIVCQPAGISRIFFNQR